MIRNLLLLTYVSVGIPVIDVGRFIAMGLEALVWAAKWLAIRLFFVTLIGTTLPVALYFAWGKISGYVMQAASSLIGTTGFWAGSVVSFTGLAGWIATTLKMPECASVLMTAYATKFALSFIRR